MQKYIALGVWGMLFGLAGLFLLAQVIAQPLRSPVQPPLSRPTTAPRPTKTHVPPIPTITQDTRGSVQGTASKIKASATSSSQAPSQPKSWSTEKTKTPSPSPNHLPPLLVGFYVFLLAIFLGFELISKVPPTLHTPLMSGANAISGITIIGALYCARTSSPSIATILGLLAVICAMINVVGGYLVTDRMLRMFRK